MGKSVDGVNILGEKMASKRERKRKDGTVSFEALFRLDGKQTSAAFDTAKARDAFIANIDRLGLEAALEIIDAHESTSTNAPTLREYGLAEIESRTGIGEYQRERYRREIRNEWGKMGSLPIDCVTEQTVKKWVRSMEKRGLSSKTIANKHGTLSSVFRTAVRDKACPVTESPCEGVKLTRDSLREEMVFLTHSEFAVLLSCVPVPYQPNVTAFFALGLRYGEEAAATVSDYDSDRELVRISKAWKRGNGKWFVGPPKTKRGRRTLAAPEQLVPYLDTMAATRQGADLLFPNARGGRLKHSTFFEDVWQPAVRLANGRKGWPDREDEAQLNLNPHSMWYGIMPASKGTAINKWPRLHDARHTAASWLINGGATLQDVQYFLGHESIKTTADRYGHLMPGRMQAVAGVMSLALSPALPAIEG